MSTAIERLIQQANTNTGNTSSSGKNAGAPIDGQDYDAWAAEKEEQGLRLTRLGKNEADFSLYMNSLSDELKNEITDSFDCEEDYELQAEIAAAFKNNNTNFLHRSDIAALCKQNGWKLERVSYSTSYIPDYKAGNFSNSVNEHGRINVYTISDGKGGSIMIADANGNGGLEIEEVYGNELLNGVVSDIQPGTSSYVKGHKDVVRGENGEVIEDPNAEDTNNGKISQEFFNSEVEELIEAGYSRSSAISKAKDQLKVTDLSYTGAMQPKTDETDEAEDADDEKLAKETQELFNETYEEYIEKGFSELDAYLFTKFDLKTNNVKYTG